MIGACILSKIMKHQNGININYRDSNLYNANGENIFKTFQPLTDNDLHRNFERQEISFIMIIIMIRIVCE